MPDSLVGSNSSISQPGELFGQIVPTLSGSVYKATIGIDVFDHQIANYFSDVDGLCVIDAINATSSRNQWVFQPFAPSYSSNSTPVTNDFQTDSYDNESVVESGPFLTYRVYFNQAGTYHVWIYGYSSGDHVAFSFNEDETILSTTLGNPGFPDTAYWTYITSLDIEAPGEYSFTLYIKDTTVLLDQIVLALDTLCDTDEFPTAIGSVTTPVDNETQGPFTLALRLRSLENGLPIDLAAIDSCRATSWRSSVNIFGSGSVSFIFEHPNFDKGIVFTNGLSLEYWQIGGSPNYYSGWNYILGSSSIGMTYTSINYGKTISCS